jgi:hypothetical protein
MDKIDPNADMGEAQGWTPLFWDSQNPLQLAGTVSGSGVDATPPPDSATPSTASNATPRGFSLQQQSNKRLTFIKEEDWDPEQTYGEDPQTISATQLSGRRR